jgi:hypothetical protein
MPGIRERSRDSFGPVALREERVPERRGIDFESVQDFNTVDPGFSRRIRGDSDSFNQFKNL